MATSYDILKKTYEEMKFSDCVYQRVDISKVNLERLKPWINKKLMDSLQIENKVVTEFICKQLQKEKFPCPKQLHIDMTGFLSVPQAQQFMDELWSLLISAEESETGIPAKCLEPKNYKTAANDGEEQEQQRSSPNSNEICNSNNEDNKNSNTMECQSNQEDKSRPNDGEIDENSSSRNCSWNRIGRSRSPHEKQWQRKSRSPRRRSSKHRNRRYRSKHRNTRRYASPQRRRDISWTTNRQSRSRFVEKHKASPFFISASAKRNLSQSRDTYAIQNDYINGDISAKNRSASRNGRSKAISASHLRSESRSTYRSSPRHPNYKHRASRSVSLTSSPEWGQNKRQYGYNRDSSSGSFERDSGRLQGGRRDDSRSRFRSLEYDRYGSRSPDRYNRLELQSRQRSRSRSLSRNRSRSPGRFGSPRRSRSRYRQRSLSRSRSRSPRRSHFGYRQRSFSRSRSRSPRGFGFQRRSLSRFRSRSPRRFNRCRSPFPFRGNNRRRLTHWNRKRQNGERFGGRANRYRQQRYISPQRRFIRERRFSPCRNQFLRNSPQRLSPERTCNLQEQNIFSPMQVSTPEHEDSTCNSWNQTKNSEVTMTPKQCPPVTNISYKESKEAGAKKRKHCDLEDGNLQESVINSNEAQYLTKKKPKKSKHNSDDDASEAEAPERKKHKKRSSKKSKKRDKKYKKENKKAQISCSKDKDNLENAKSDLSCTESNIEKKI